MVAGVMKFRRRLEKVAPAIFAEVRPVLEREATKLVAQMKALAPVLKEPDGRRRPGALRDSINWTWGNAGPGLAVLGRVSTSRSAGIFITIYAGSRDKSLGVDDAFYAVFQEFGTEHHPASPYFFPVIRANRQGVRSAITRAAKRGARKA